MTHSSALLNDLVKIVDKFVRKVKKDRKEPFLGEMRRVSSTKDYYTQHGSLALGLPRRAGNTSLALKLLKKYPKSVYVGCCIQRAFAEITHNNEKDRKRFFSLALRNFYFTVPCDTEIVITDNLYYAKEEALSRMYQSLDRYHPIYIHLGTTR